MKKELIPGTTGNCIPVCNSCTKLKTPGVPDREREKGQMNELLFYGNYFPNKQFFKSYWRGGGDFFSLKCYEWLFSFV